MSDNQVENLKLTTGAAKPPLGIVPMHALTGVARVLEDSACKYAPGNFMAQPLEDALESYDSALLRHRTACTMLDGLVSPKSYAACDEDSGLPHIDHMIAGLLILRSLMIRDGALPVDPGQGKRKLAADAKKTSDKAAFFEAMSEFDKARAFYEQQDLAQGVPGQTAALYKCPLEGCAACNPYDGSPNTKGVKL